MFTRFRRRTRTTAASEPRIGERVETVFWTLHFMDRGNKKRKRIPPTPDEGQDP